MDDHFSAPLGKYSPNGLQRIIIEAARHSGPLHKALRNTASKWVQVVRAGPVDYDLFGLKARFFPFNNPGDRRALFTPGQFDREERELILGSLPQNGVFLDIGANIGVYSLWVAAKRPDVRVFAFEPSPAVMRKLRFNIVQNNLEDQIVAKELALSDRVGELRFNSKDESLVLGEADISVKTDTLLNVLQREKIGRIDAVKIDVEGAEDKVLFPFFETAPKTLWPRRIVIEHSFPDQWTRDCLHLLEGKGYRQRWKGKLNTVYELV